MLQQEYNAIIILRRSQLSLRPVYAEHAPLYDPAIFTCGLPVQGICYALMHAITQQRIR
ncbi:putative GMP synthase [Daphnia magna]|uniref:Putative GMP synthase n=1 Tax=Daphnia magna TaxID=35525 RepID=A0A162CVP8_9CRUS|nr:putative GMP synthase [Daphnia magna]